MTRTQRSSIVHYPESRDNSTCPRTPHFLICWYCEDVEEGDLRPGVLTIYTEKPEIPGGKSNGTFHSVRNVPEKVGGRLSRSTFLALFGFPGWSAYHFNFPLFSRFFTQDKTKWRRMRETKVVWKLSNNIFEVHITENYFDSPLIKVFFRIEVYPFR